MNNHNQTHLVNIDDIRQKNHDNEKFALRVIEALLFSAHTPLSVDEFYTHLPDNIHCDGH